MLLWLAGSSQPAGAPHFLPLMTLSASVGRCQVLDAIDHFRGSSGGGIGDEEAPFLMHMVITQPSAEADEFRCLQVQPPSAAPPPDRRGLAFPCAPPAMPSADTSP